ncbi:hepatitis A virus cellular receptor 1 homolog [Nothobranchius furzeri]|uniref:hepatitis A virus cellular receptor 1 homolog n=1 Tax=Nothobranchius furzeri TaxID=105023 RepID=UPI003904BA1C
MKTVLLLSLLSATGCSCATVVGQTGQKVTLTCNYDTQQHGALHVCWGRGDVPLRGCDNLLVSTDGHKVTERVSSSFQLLGRLDQGDVSLTIQNLTTKDAGRYGCRVEIPGWANDEKRQFDLAVERAPDPSPDPTTSPTSEPEPITADQTAAQRRSWIIFPLATIRWKWPSSRSHISPMTSMHYLTHSSHRNQTVEHSLSRTTVVLECVLFLLVVLLAAAGPFIITRRRTPLRTPQQQVQVSSTVSNRQLHHRSSVVENVYEVLTQVTTSPAPEP